MLSNPNLNPDTGHHVMIATTCRAETFNPPFPRGEGVFRQCPAMLPESKVFFVTGARTSGQYQEMVSKTMGLVSGAKEVCMGRNTQ
jgi:hypothetical protein